jgi:hypoxanthine phosphoribosyltransferase
MKSVQIKEIIALNQDGLNACSLALSEKVRKDAFIPEHIVYIERAGLFVGYLAAKHFFCRLSGIYSRRDGMNMKPRLKRILRHLPKTITHLLRKAELRYKFQTAQVKRYIEIVDPLPSKNVKILIVDDSADTSYSLKSVYDFFIQNRYKKENIKTAVLTAIHPDSPFKPDYALFSRTILTCPWSYDSRSYERTWQLYETIRTSIKDGTAF